MASLPAASVALPEVPVLLFDGECNLCSGVVQFVLRHDRRGEIRFLSLQAPQAAALVQAAGGEALPRGNELESMVLLQHGRAYYRSDAAIRLGKALGGGWAALAAVAGWFPRGLRDGVYRWVARNRYRWFGRRDTCWLPTPAYRARFLDGGLS